MINLKMILRIMGILSLIEAVLLLLCAGVSLIYGESIINDFLMVAAGSVIFGGLLLLMGKGASKQLNRRNGYLIVTLSWLLFSAIGMFPFLISGYVPRVVDAFFETMSGFTTTGATVIDNIESLPHGLLFWRSLTQWAGGLGIIFFTIAMLPLFGMGSMHLFSAEATGTSHERLHPRISITAKWIWYVYFGLTLALTLFLLLGGMNLFDSICHSFSTISTGGFSTKKASIAYYSSPYIEYVISIFMILSGINFTLFFYLAKGKPQKALLNEELKWFLKSIIVFTAIFTVTLTYTSPYGVGESFRKALFQVASLHTTTGLVSADYMVWTPFLWALLGVIMFLGASSGCTSGAIKSIRLLILGKMTKNEFKRMVHPNAVLPVKINKIAISPSTQSSVLLFILLYMIIFVASWLAMMAMGVGNVEAFGTVVSSMGSVGPGLGLCGPVHSWNCLPDGGKWLLSFLMLIGRLELFTVLLLFTPQFWKKR
ncbi:TrkH family potassium uptake protein [uncultured Bacteroides sp.]|uniref:TrkH family potassium uptake protein n=1 Tax=uncultured Bacteroides sp. TaxID=162156 RepID=UPI002AAB07EA|nr:TrkH family potassium uptake protein [uncultured Bacteroides sp.]